LESNLRKDDFPTNPFEDIPPVSFNKLNKKEVTEDFVAENFRLLGWTIYKPFTDTGIDRILVKSVCPDNHTKLNENIEGGKCNKCGKDPIEIFRFIQIKTRGLRENVFGFTLKTKDIRIDPRHFYILYSDRTTNEKQDFLIISIEELLKFFHNSDINPFQSKAFRTGNNKLNSLKYDLASDKWMWGRDSWEQFRNWKGLEKMQDPDMDNKLRVHISCTRELANKLQIVFSAGNSYSQDLETKVNSELSTKLKKFANKSVILDLRNRVDQYLKKKCDDDTFRSHEKYFENVKLSEALGEDDTYE